MFYGKRTFSDSNFHVVPDAVVADEQLRLKRDLPHLHHHHYHRSFMPYPSHHHQLVLRWLLL